LAFPADIWVSTSSALTLQISQTSGGGGCDADCQSPTLGIDKKLNRIVENGFTYNGNPVNAELYFTSYPLIKTTTGIYNTAKLKIYDNGGPDNIRHVELAFGLAKGKTINERQASIFWDKHFDGTEFVTVKSPNNAIDSVKIESKIESCRTDSQDQCLVLIIHHRFRTPLDFDIVGTNVWDERRNAWQNYFNHGIHVKGKSFNSPEQHFGIHNGNLIKITQLDKKTAIDDEGNIWIYDKSWKINFAPKGKVDDGVTSLGFDRNNARFNTYKMGQELLAQHVLDSMIRGSINNDSVDLPKTHHYEFLKRSEDLELQKRIDFSQQKALNIFNQLFDVEQNH